MITCPNCNHQNPDGAVQCEACYTPLPSLVDCPSCGTPVQTTASFCGQCGTDLRGRAVPGPAPGLESEAVTIDVSSGDMPSENRTPNDDLNSEVEIPDLLPPDPLIATEAEAVTPIPDSPVAEVESPASMEPPPPLEPPALRVPPSQLPSHATQLQVTQARLLHVQTDTPIELPRQLSVIRMGKANDRIPPDIDVSGFPNSEIVSRAHANLRVEGDIYYLEDIGSSNGTYVNNLPLPNGNRHRLRPGDRFSLGKGDKVSFIFQVS